MRKALFLILLSLLSMYGIAQDKKPVNYNVNMEIKTEPAHFPNGDEAFFDYIFKHLTYSKDAIDKRVRGKIDLSFDVEPDSTLSNIVIMNGVGSGIDEDIINIIKPLKFAPKAMNGKKFKSNLIYTIPIFAH